jgi:hypothetical protein
MDCLCRTTYGLIIIRSFRAMRLLRLFRVYQPINEIGGILVRTVAGCCAVCRGFVCRAQGCCRFCNL